MNNSKKYSQRGSVFVFLLIGVALFAALSYAISQSLRMGTDQTGSATGPSEQSTVSVSDMMQFLDALKTRVFEMTNMNHVPESKLDFKNDVYLLSNGNEISTNNNAACGAAATCSVFAPYGTNGLLPMLFPTASDHTLQSSPSLPQNGHGTVAEIELKGVGTTAPDLIFLIHGIKPNICNLYNSKQGIGTDYDHSTTLTSIGESPSNSVPVAFNGFTTTNTFGYAASEFEGKKSFCAPAYDDAMDHRLAIWHVLKVR